MDIVDIERKAKAEAETELLIYNPLSEDVTHKYGGVDYSIPSKENKAFKTPIARHMGNHLVDLYINTKDKNYPRSEAEKLVFPN